MIDLIIFLFILLVFFILRRFYTFFDTIPNYNFSCLHVERLVQ